MSMGTNLILLPFMLYFLSGEQLGLWYVFLSIGAVVTLFDFGFNPTLVRNIAYCWSGAEELRKTDVTFVQDRSPNIPLLKQVISTCKTIYLIISAAAIVVLLTFGTMYVLHISSNLSGNDPMIAWLIYVISVFFHLYYGYYTSFLRGVGAIAQLNMVNIVARAFQIVVSIILLILGLQLIAVALAYLVYGLLLRYLSKQSFYTFDNIGLLLLKDKSRVGYADIRRMFTIIWHNAWRDGLVSLSIFFSGQASIILCSLYLGLTTTGVYSISIQLITAIVAISGSLYSAYQPSLQAAFIHNNVAESRRIMSTVMTVYFLLFGTGMIALLFIVLPLLNVLNPGMIISIPLLLVIAVYEFLLKHHQYYASYISNTNHVSYMFSFVASSTVSIVLAWILISTTPLGVWGLIIPPFVIQAMYNHWVWPSQVMRSLNTNLKGMLQEGLSEIGKVVIAKTKKV